MTRFPRRRTFIYFKLNLILVEQNFTLNRLLSMIDSGILDSITQFGEKILNPNENEIIFEPQFDATPDQLPVFIDLIKNEKDSAQVVGLINLLPRVLVTVWEYLNEEQKSQVCGKLSEKFSFDFNEKSIGKYADSCISVYKFSLFKWDGLINFIFSDNTDPLTGYLFVRLMSAVDGQFIKDNLNRIVDLLVKLFSNSSCSVLTGLIVILSIIDTKSAINEHQELVNLLWGALFKIFEEEPDRITFILPLLSEIFTSVPEIRDITVDIVSNKISTIDNSDNAQNLIKLLPFLNLDDLTSLIAKLLSLADKFIKENNEIPKDLISDIDESPLDSLTEPAICKIIDILKPQLDTPAALTIFAPFAPHIAEKFGEKELFGVVEKSIQETPIKIALGLAIFECLSGYSDDLPFDLPDALMFKFLNLLVSDEEFVRNAAFSTISALIENDIFIHTDQTKALLKIYPLINQRAPNREDLILFFKLLRKLLRVEGVSEEVVTELFDFSMENISINSKRPKEEEESAYFYMSQCLSIICAVASQEADELVIQEIPTLLPISIDILNSNHPDFLVYASRTLVLLTSLSPKDSRRKVLSLLPRLFQISTGEFETSPKIKGNIAVALASIMVCLDVKKDFVKCIEIIQHFADSHEPHLVTAASTMAEILRSTKDNDLNFAIFDILSKLAMTTKEGEQLNALLNAIRKIMKNYLVPEEKVLPLLQLLISGAHPVFGRRPPSMYTDKSTKLYSYLTEVCVRYEDLREQITPIAISWLSSSPSFMLSVSLQLITYLVTEKVIKADSENAIELIKILVNRMGGNQKQDIDEILLGNILILLKDKNQIYDIQKLAEQLKIDWQDTKEDEISGWRAQVGSAILVLCALGADADKEMIEDILSDYPFTPEFGKCEEMSEALVKMCDNSDNKWENVKPAIAKSITDVLLLPKEQLEQYNIPQPLVVEMKRVLKAIIRSSSIIEREITKSFGKNRPLQNRFKNLLK